MACQRRLASRITARPKPSSRSASSTSPGWWSAIRRSSTRTKGKGEGKESGWANESGAESMAPIVAYGLAVPWCAVAYGGVPVRWRKRFPAHRAFAGPLPREVPSA
ncbi:hypothetical protein SVIO_039810 [Streptomyces violaceusniger]|uniref:Uncharacterized protein n=1 Tax=Streptomyces violaceusniger TaxID=68280 RepID=A0A4D4L452_STRVO|nr:hypothetical protein SVIO_039810 [Streptomyces violaceusniger]